MTETAGPLWKRPILLATDGSSIAARARTIAVDLSRRSGAPLHIVHVWGVAQPFGSIATRHDRESMELHKRSAHDLVAHEASVAAESGAPLVRSHVVHDGPGSVILLTAHTLDPALVVLGSRGQGAVRRAVLGSVSEFVTHEATHPVLVVPEDCPWPPGRVVVGDDGSEEAHRAAVLAAHLARILGVEVVLVHGRRGQVAGMEGVSRPDWLEKRATRLEAAEGCRVTSHVSDDDAVSAISRVARTFAAMVVIGAHRRSSQLTRRGSISTALLRHLNLPLVVVRPPHPAWTPAAARDPLEVAR